MSPAVSLVRSRSYHDREVMEGLRQALHLLGGMGAFVKKGDRVLLKPNLLFGKDPEKAVTTHPSMVKGVIEMVREAGGVPFIGDSPGIGSVMKAAEKAGIKAIAEAADCPIVEFNRPVLAQGGRAKTFKHLEIDQVVLEADVLINLPKWKTHGMMLLTLGVKNLFGCIPGSRKALWHLRAGADHKIFARMLVDLYRVIRPSLTILDGVVGMEGNGPSSGRPIPLGLILASGDALSLDQIVCDLLGISRKALMTNRMAFEQGMGREEIEVLGEEVKAVGVPGFEFPPSCRTDWNLPGFLRKALSNALTAKPVIERAKCKACDHCLEICPPRALERRESDLAFDYGRCIRCFCCQEICEEGAITIEPGWASKWMNRRNR